MKQILLSFLIIISIKSFAQLPDYYVYLVKGSVTIAKPKSKAAPVKQQQLVYKNDVLVLNKESEITLVDRDANFLSISTPGNYKGGDMYKYAIKQKTEGLTSKYLKLLYHELLDPNHDYEKLENENIAGVWGGVSRSDECNNRIFPLNGLKTAENILFFNWHRSSPSSNYTFSLYNAEGKEIFFQKVKDTVYRMMLKETIPSPGKYFWRVMSEDGNCEDEIPIYFDILSKDNENLQIEQLLLNTNSHSLEQKLDQIDKLEKNGFTLAASERYSGIIQDNPGNEALRKSYVLFLMKYGLNDEVTAAGKGN